MKNRLTIIQARRGSSRLPNKILLPLAGAPLLVRMYERVAAATSVGKVVVATTTDAQDDLVASLCQEHNIEVFRGHPTNLLDRHYQAALYFGAKTVVKIPSDCPLICPKVIDNVLTSYDNSTQKHDYFGNLHPASYPDGNDVELMTIEAMKRAWQEATKPHELEHTTPYFWDTEGLFNVGAYLWETGLDYAMSHRFTIDYKEDYDFIERVYNELYPKNPMFSLNDILNLLEEKPEIMAINSKYLGVNWYRNHLGELKTIDNSMTRKLD